MVIQIFVGLLMTAVTIAFDAVAIVMGSRFLRQNERWLREKGSLLRHTIALTLVGLWLVLALLVIMLAWAVILYLIGIFEGLEPAIYFSSISFTTLGFGDLILPDAWRLLSGFIATGGFILFGLNTAFLYEVLRELRRND